MGGDHFEFRIFDFYVPVLAWLTAESLVVVWTRWSRWGAMALGVVLLIYSLVIPTSDSIHNREIGGDAYMKELYLPTNQFKVTVDNTPVASWLPGMAQLIRAERALQGTLNTHGVGTRFQVHRSFWLKLKSDLGLARGVAERGVLPPMTLNAGNPGILGYYIDVPIIDQLGLTDPYVSHVPGHKQLRFMAHEKLVPWEYLERRHAHVHIISATTHPLPQERLPPGPMVERERGTYSIRLGGGVWLNIRSLDFEWVRANFIETPTELIPRGAAAE